MCGTLTCEFLFLFALVYAAAPKNPRHPEVGIRWLFFAFFFAVDFILRFTLQTCFGFRVCDLLLLALLLALLFLLRHVFSNTQYLPNSQVVYK